MFNSLFDFLQEEGFYLPEYRVVEDANNTAIILDMPGVTAEELKVGCENNVLRIEVKTESKGYVRLFSRSWVVSPSVFDLHNIKAEIENGVLTLMLPKLESAKPRSIPIRTATAPRQKTLAAGAKV